MPTSHIASLRLSKRGFLCKDPHDQIPAIVIANQAGREDNHLVTKRGHHIRVCIGLQVPDFIHLIEEIGISCLIIEIIIIQDM